MCVACCASPRRPPRPPLARGSDRAPTPSPPPLHPQPRGTGRRRAEILPFVRLDARRRRRRFAVPGVGQQLSRNAHFVGPGGPRQAPKRLRRGRWRRRGRQPRGGAPRARGRRPAAALVDDRAVSERALRGRAGAARRPGRAKAAALRAALLAVVPDAEIEVAAERFCEASSAALLGGSPDYVLLAVRCVRTLALGLARAAPSESCARCPCSRPPPLPARRRLGAGARAAPRGLGRRRRAAPRAAAASGAAGRAGAVCGRGAARRALGRRTAAIRRRRRAGAARSRRAAQLLAGLGHAAAAVAHAELAGLGAAPAAPRRLMSRGQRDDLVEGTAAARARGLWRSRAGAAPPAATNDLWPEDVERLVNDVWGRRCALSGAGLGGPQAMVLTRWDRRRPAAVDNLVLLAKARAEEHDAAPHAALFGEARARAVEAALRTARRECRRVARRGLGSLAFHTAIVAPRLLLSPLLASARARDHHLLLLPREIEFGLPLASRASARQARARGAPPLCSRASRASSAA